MNYRDYGRTGWQVSEIGFGAWPIGSGWGRVDDADSLAALHEALDRGVNLIDTADGYGDGRSEQLIGQVLRERSGERIYVTTKAGRRLRPHVADGYTAENLAAFVERSLHNLGVETLDVLQLHCPPTEVFYRPEVFGALDDLVDCRKAAPLWCQRGKGRRGTQGHRVSQRAVGADHFQHVPPPPSRAILPPGQVEKVGVLARVPLASGLLTGRMGADTVFEASDHRNFNRYGESFDVGETFAGVPYEAGLEAVEELRPLVPEGATMAQLALRWILMFDAVSCAIPGAKTSCPSSRQCRRCRAVPLERRDDGCRARHL